MPVFSAKTPPIISSSFGSLALFAHMLVADPLEFLAYLGVIQQHKSEIGMAEKQKTLVESRDGSSDEEEFTWTEEEEKALVRR